MVFILKITNDEVTEAEVAETIDRAFRDMPGRPGSEYSRNLSQDVDLMRIS